MRRIPVPEPGKTFRVYVVCRLLRLDGFALFKYDGYGNPLHVHAT